MNPYHDLITGFLFNWRDLGSVMVSAAYISMDQSRSKNALAASGEGSRGVAL